MVAVAVTSDAPLILERRKIVISDPEMPGSRQPYHAAAGLPLAQAQTRLQDAIASSRALSLASLSEITKLLAAEGHFVEACAILRASGKPLPEIAAILASHALIHTAEGELFRDVLAWAAGECHLPVTFVREKELAPDLVRRVEPLGKKVGPPWTQDQKFAAAAALMSLAWL